MTKPATTTSKPFWADLSAKTATWGGVAALAVTALEVVEPLVEAEATTAVSWKHGLAVIGAAVIRDYHRSSSREGRRPGQGFVCFRPGGG